MWTATMGKKKSAPKGGEKKKPVIKVSETGHELIHRTAGARGQSPEELFDSRDVREFLTHLLVGAGEEAKKRLEAQQKQ